MAGEDFFSSFIDSLAFSCILQLLSAGTITTVQQGVALLPKQIHTKMNVCEQKHTLGRQLTILT